MHFDVVCSGDGLTLFSLSSLFRSSEVWTGSMKLCYSSPGLWTSVAAYQTHTSGSRLTKSTTSTQLTSWSRLKTMTLFLTLILTGETWMDRLTRNCPAMNQWTLESYFTVSSGQSAVDTSHFSLSLCVSLPCVSHLTLSVVTVLSLLLNNTVMFVWQELALGRFCMFKRLPPKVAMISLWQYSVSVCVCVCVLYLVARCCAS